VSALAKLIDDLAGEQPSLIRLAEAVSLAARVDPPLLRKARLELVPEADAGTEADLWRSPLVKTRSPDGFVFLPEAAEALRSSLAKDSQRLAHCRTMTEALHKHLSPAVQLEEEVAWLSVVKGPEAADRIQELLLSALAALVVDERRGLASWAARALPALPSSVRDSATASMLHAGAQLRLGRSSEPLRGEREMPDWAPWIAPADLPRVPIAVRLFPDKVELDAQSPDRGARLDLPATDPLLVDLLWDGGGVQVTFRKGEVQPIRVPAQEIRLRTVLGEVYDLRKQGTAPRGVRDRIIDFTEERKRHRPFFGRERELSALGGMVLQGGNSGMVLAVEEEIGSGKTALLAALIDRLETSTGILPPHHFFRRGDARTEDLRAAERSLVAQIVSRIPGIPPSLSHASLSDLLVYLFDHRLLSRPLVIVLDAIDESVEPQGEPGSLNRLFQTDVPPGVVVIASARPGSLALGVGERFPLGKTSEATLEYWRGKGGEVHSDTIRRDWEISQDSFHLADILFAWLSDQRPGIRSLENVRPGGLLGSILEQAASTMDGEILANGLGLVAAAREPLPRFVTHLHLGENDRRFADALFPLLLPPGQGNEPVFAPRNETVRRHLEVRLGAERMLEAHRRLAERVAPLPWESAKFPIEVRIYGLRHGVEHWLKARDHGSAFRLATSPAFLSEHFERLGPDSAARSLRVWQNAAPMPHEDSELKMVQEILRVLDENRHFLAKDPAALPSILYSGLQAASLPMPGDAPSLRRAAPFPPEGLVRTPPIRHQGGVTGCAFTSLLLGPQILSWSTDGTLRLWEQTQADLRIFAGHTAEVTGCVVLDEVRAVSSSRDCTLRVWDMRRQSLRYILRTLWGHEGEVLGVLAVDAKRAVSWSMDRTLRVWDLDEGRADQVLQGHEGAVTTCTLEGKSDLLVSGSDDTTVRVWNLSGALIHTLRGHTAPITCVAVLDGNLIVSGSQDRSLRVWSLQGGEALQVLEGHSLGILGCTVSPDGRILASWSQDRTIRLWSLELVEEEGPPVRPLATLAGHEGAVLDCTFYSEGDRLVSGSADRTVRIWDVETSEPLAVLVGHEGPVRAVAIDSRPTRGTLAPMTAQIVSASDDRTLRVWNAQEYHPEAFLDGDDATLLCIPFQDRLRVATVSRLGDIRIHHVGDPVPAWIGSPSMSIGGAVLAMDDQRLILWPKGLIEGQARVTAWDLASREEAMIPTGQRAPILACSVTPDDMLLTASLDGDVQKGSLENDRITLYSVKAPVCDMQVSRGRVLAACWDGTLRLWDLETARELLDRALEGHTDRVLACAISGSGDRAASASADGTLRLWNLETGSTVRVLTGHTAEVTGCAFTGDGMRIVSRSKDGKVGIWDTERGELIAFTQGHTDWVNAIALDEEIGIVYSCSEDQTVRAWDLTTGATRGVVYGVSPFRSLAVVQSGVYAGDEAGNLWKLEYGAAPEQREEPLEGGVFLSYPAKDRELARRLSQELRQADVEVWMDEEILQAGDHLETGIRRWIERCSLFVPLISRSSLDPEPRFFRREWTFALEQSQRLPSNQPFIVPILIGDVDFNDASIPEEFRRIQALRLPDKAKSSEEVVRTIRDLYHRARRQHLA
jgi:WD40 repeat protein